MKHLFPSSLNKILIAGFIFLVLMQSNLVIAKTPEEKGFEIASRSDRSDRGFNNSESTATMVLRNKQGKESKRILFQRTLEVPG